MAITVSFDKNEALNEVFETQIVMDHLHVRFGRVTIIFYDIQQGFDILDSLVHVPPLGLAPADPNQLELF